MARMGRRWFRRLLIPPTWRPELTVLKLRQARRCRPNSSRSRQKLKRCNRNFNGARKLLM